MKPWTTLSTIETPEGPLELRQRGERDFLIMVAGRVLMTSTAHRSEEDLATLTCERLGQTKRPRVLVGGLGMGYTLRATLDRMPPGARITVVDLNQTVVDWCRGPLTSLTRGAIDDPRVDIRIDDLANAIADAPPGHYDAIIIDLYEGPYIGKRIDDPLYGIVALARTMKALRRGGVFSVWGEEPDREFPGLMSRTGFDVTQHRAGRGGRKHVIYVGVRP